MILFKKAELEDMHTLTMAIMSMKTDIESITSAEMQEYMDRLYYCTIDDKIVAIVVAIRQQLTQNTQYPDYMSTTFPSRYNIKYALMDKGTIEDNGYNTKSIMCRLFRELCADLSDWSVWFDVDYHASINGMTSEEDAKEILVYVAESNSFRPCLNRFCYLRVTPIDFGALH